MQCWNEFIFMCYKPDETTERVDIMFDIRNKIPVEILFNVLFTDDVSVNNLDEITPNERESVGERVSLSSWPLSM